ncbi:hypothetical protein DV515_00001972, partial [Chloebia gouldiae]
RAHDCTRYRHPCGFRPSIHQLNPRTLPPTQPCAFREDPGAATLPSPPAGTRRHRTGLCRGLGEFLLSLLRLRLPSKANGFACASAIRACEPAGRALGVRVQTLLGKGAEARVYLFKDGGEKKVFVYIVISEKLFCDTVAKGCFVVDNNMVSADFSVTS